MSLLEYNLFDADVQPPKLVPDYKSTVLRAPQQPLVLLKQSLSELTGPVFGDFELGEFDHDLTKNAIKNAEPACSAYTYRNLAGQFGRAICA
jgi:protocatechuate 3,4-dioxygenase, beta subunit